MKKIKYIIYKLLRRSEHFTKTDMVYLASSGFWITLVNTVIGINVFITALAFANLLPREIFGEYKYALSIFSILKMFSLEAMNTAVTRSVAKGFDGAIFKGVKSKIIWGLIGMLFSFALAAYYYYANNNTFASIFIVVGGSIPLFDTFALYASYFNGKKLFATLTKYNLIVEILTTIILVTALFLTNNIIIILLAYFLPYIIIRFFALILAWRNYNFNKSFSSETISYGKHLSLMTVASTLANNLDRVLLWFSLNPVSVAIFSLAVAIPDHISSTVKGIRNIALPKISEKEETAVKNELAKKIFKATIVLIPIAIIYIFTAPLLFKILFPQYPESIFYSQLYSIIIIMSPQILFITYLEAHAKKKEQYYITTATPIFRIISFAILIPLYGIMGGIISIIITRIFSYCLSYYLFKKL